MKPRVILPILAFLMIILGVACKKSSDSKEPYDLTNTEWQGEARMYDRDFKPVKVQFKENKKLEISFVAVDDPSSKFTFTGTWQKAEDSDNVIFEFIKGLETVTSTATLTEGNTKMADGKFKSSGDPNQDAGNFNISRQ